MGRWSGLVRWTSLAESCTQVRPTRGGGLVCPGSPSLSCSNVSPRYRVEALRSSKVSFEGSSIAGGRTWRSDHVIAFGRCQPIMGESARPESTTSWWITSVDFIFRSFFLSGTLQLTLIVAGRSRVLYLGTHLLCYPEAGNLRPSILDRLFCAFCLFFLPRSWRILLCACVSRSPQGTSILRFYYNLTVDGLIIDVVYSVLLISKRTGLLLPDDDAFSSFY